MFSRVARAATRVRWHQAMAPRAMAQRTQLCAAAASAPSRGAQPVVWHPWRGLCTGNDKGSEVADAEEMIAVLEEVDELENVWYLTDDELEEVWRTAAAGKTEIDTYAGAEQAVELMLARQRTKLEGIIGMLEANKEETVQSYSNWRQWGVRSMEKYQTNQLEAAQELMKHLQADKELVLHMIKVLDYHNDGGAQNPITKERFFEAVKGGDVKEAELEELRDDP